MHLSVTGCLVSVLLHELAHIATAKAFGVRVKRVGLGWRGPYIVREPGTPAQDIFISLAGPAANAVLMFVPGLFLINLSLLIPNLIMKESDGRRAWKCWQTMASEKTQTRALVVDGIMGRRRDRIKQRGSEPDPQKSSNSKTSS